MTKTEKQDGKVEVCERNWMRRIGKSVQEKNGGAERRGWCEREFQEEADEESLNVGWTRRKLERMEGERLMKIAGVIITESRSR